MAVFERVVLRELFNLNPEKKKLSHKQYDTN